MSGIRSFSARLRDWAHGMSSSPCVVCFTHTHTHILHTYTHTHMHTCTHVHTYIRTYVHTYIRTYVHTDIRTHGHTDTWTYASIQLRKGFGLEPLPSTAAKFVGHTLLSQMGLEWLSQMGREWLDNLPRNRALPPSPDPAPESLAASLRHPLCTALRPRKVSHSAAHGTCLTQGATQKHTQLGVRVLCGGLPAPGVDKES